MRFNATLTRRDLRGSKISKISRDMCCETQFAGCLRALNQCVGSVVMQKGIGWNRMEWVEWLGGQWWT